MKKLLFIVLFSLVFMSSTNIFAASNFSAKLQEKLQTAVVLHIGQSKAYVNNSETVVDSTNNSVYPLIKDGRTLVPVRFISENLGAKVEWNDSLKAVEVKMNGKNVKLAIGSNKIYVNGTENKIDVPAQIINERTFIPLRALMESLGKKVFWDDRGLIVISEKENIFDETEDKELVDEIVGKLQTNNGLTTNPKELFDYMKLDKKQVFDKIGTKYEEVPTGVEASSIGYYCKDLDITFSFDKDSSNGNSSRVWWIDCGDTVRINGARNGMTFEQIQDILGKAQIEETFIEIPENKAYEIYYKVGDINIIYLSANQDGNNGRFSIYNIRNISDYIDKQNSDEAEKNLLVGSWHAAPSVASGHQERYVFYSNKKFVFFTNQYDEYREYIALAGSWEVKNKTLYLTINERYDMDNIKKTANEKKELSIGDIEKESPKNSPYEYKIDIGNLTFWKYSDTTDYFKDEIKSLDKTEGNKVEKNKALKSEDFDITYNGFTINSSTEVSEIIQELGYGEDYEANNNGLISTNNGYRCWQLCYPSTDDTELRLVFLSNLLNEDDTYLVFADLKSIPTKRGLFVGDSIDNMFELYGEPYNVSAEAYKVFKYIMGAKSIEILTDEDTNTVSHILVNYNIERANKDQNIYESEEDKDVKAAINIVKKKHNAKYNEEDDNYSIDGDEYLSVIFAPNGIDEKGRVIIRICPSQYPLSVLKYCYVDINTEEVEEEP